MVSVMSLWLPALISAVLCFFLSSLVHMVFKWHNKDHQAIPQEDRVLKSMRDAGITKGSYAFPWPGEGQSWGSPDMLERYQQGPSGFLRVLPLGPPQMGKSLMQWFAYLLLVGFGVAWILSLTMSAGAAYKTVCQTVAISAGMAHILAQLVPFIWMGQPWRATLLHILDGVFYALLTAGSFAWLWPR